MAEESHAQLWDAVLLPNGHSNYDLDAAANEGGKVPVWHLDSNGRYIPPSKAKAER